MIHGEAKGRDQPNPPRRGDIEALYADLWGTEALTDIPINWSSEVPTTEPIVALPPIALQDVQRKESYDIHPKGRQGSFLCCKLASDHNRTAAMPYLYEYIRSNLEAEHKVSFDTKRLRQ